MRTPACAPASRLCLALDGRFTALVLITGVLGMTDHARTSPNPFWEKWRRVTPKDKMERYLDAFAPLDARHYLGHSAPAHLLFQAGRHDD